jgi:hypothetical protein
LFYRKKYGRGGGKFLAVFLLFSRGFWEKWVFWRGVLLVRLWWLAGETWCFGCAFLAYENYAIFLSFFCGTWRG